MMLGLQLHCPPRGLQVGLVAPFLWQLQGSAPPLYAAASDCAEFLQNADEVTGL